MPVCLLDNDNLWFPDPYEGERNGLVAIGGDLSPERLFLAYSFGFFPWFDFRLSPKPMWYCPLDRFVIFPDQLHISHSMRPIIAKNKYFFTFNKAFAQVIRACSEVDGRHKMPGAWLGPDIIAAYTRIHEMGFAKSVEVWDTSGGAGNEGASGKLVGGLYGVQIRGAFFGESMFSLVPNASKLALVFLADLCRRYGWKFIDCQFETPLFKSMGGRYVAYDEYLELLDPPQPFPA